MSIISFDRTNSRNRSSSPRRSKVHLWCNYYRSPAIIYRSPATVIDRPPLFIDRPSLLSIARHYYRSQCHANRANNLLIMIIALGVGESATGGLSHPYPLFDHHYYPIIFMHKGVLTESTPF
ncbi:MULTISPECIES: hypothetical protein [unclassified Microcoleus]|uniref:hypothetical protein n=1 Tax=unclassified Microcoleus TaxID=2642155 RepID=UPI002FD5ADE9